jgi:acyl carrier protein/carbon monoxide dehydrogenase subunit G
LPSEITLDQLISVITRCAGEPENHDPGGTPTDATYDWLGYDSIALLEVSACVKQELGLKITIEPTDSPESTLRQINDQISRRKPDMTRRTKNTIRITAPIDRVWDFTNDVANWRDIFPRFSDIDVTRLGEDEFELGIRTYPNEQGKVLEWRSHRIHDRANRTVTVSRIDESIFVHVRMVITYRTVGDMTELHWAHEFDMKPDSHLTNEQMTEHFNENDRMTLSRIKTMVEKRNPAARASAR